MDNDDLFEAFESEPQSTSNDPQITNKQPLQNQHSYLNKKTSRNNDSSLPSSSTKQPTHQSQEQIDDITFQKNVTQILTEPLSSENPLNPDSEVKITSHPFSGGVHETIFPKNTPIIELKKPTTPPATTYPFTLDPFQERSILCLENHQSVLVAAHTSAGKTVVAQYAIAMSLRDHQRVIYTSPIKALSNQKFRELSQQFKDVGLMTGDVTLNPDASCIVMTTEILRNMLYKGSEITKEIAWVIFDEVHYMRDKARGVVWEETMILLSNKINYVFLSATIPNAREFAMWISKLKSQPCNVVYTDFRPVPLQHYVYPSGSDSIYLAVDAKGNFKEENFNKVLSTLAESELEKNIDKSKNSKAIKTEEDIKRIVELINEQNLNPSIVFSFSKAECEELACSLSKIDLTTDEEKELIESIYTNAIMTLSTEDQNLPQIEKMLPILKKGVGVHHGGMLPIVRECVELIFQEGLIKTLFSTETFSMGVNMPAKTVVFTNLEKFDGNDHRFVTGGEFIQMSGRAGRRKNKKKGITILMLKKKMEPEKIREILSGQSDPLNSSFCLSYNQIVNLSRIEGVKCEYILKRSFRQFQAERAVPIIKSKIRKLFDEYQKFDFNWERDDLVKNIIITKDNISAIKEENRSIITKPKNIIGFLTPGRIVHIKNWGIGIVVNFSKKTVEKVSQYNEKKECYEMVKYENTDKTIDEINKSKMIELYIVDIVVYLKNEKDNKLTVGDIKKKNGKIAIVPFLLSTFEGVSQIKVNIPKNLKERSALLSLEKMLFEINAKFKSEVPKMDPIKEMSINDPTLKSNLTKLSSLKASLSSYESSLLSKFGNDMSQKDISSQLISSYKAKLTLRSQIKFLMQDLNATNRLILQEDLSNMKRVLRRLGFIEDEVVTIKGQVACCISSADEVILTEMLFNGAFNSLDENSLSSMLSCFLTTEGSGFPNESKKAEENQFLSSLHDIINKNSERVADVLIECKIPIDKEKFIKSFRMDYMYPVLNWTQGEKTFGDICKDTEIYEGSLIRVIRRLDELLKELSECARLIGNMSLKEKLESTSKKIQRGIPFAASLYLSN